MSLINGKQQDNISVMDRGLAYGDGIFETIAGINGRLHLWPCHWQRLQEGGKRLKLPIPEEALLLSWIDKALSEQNYPSTAVVKIIISRGSGGRGYRCPEQTETQTMITIHPWPQRNDKDYQQGIKVKVCETALAVQPLLAGIKHLNRLEQVLAAQELNAGNYQEGIMLENALSELGAAQIVVEGVSSNLFFVSSGQLLTPEITYSGVKGTMRDEVMQRAQSLGLEPDTGRFSLSEVLNADEVFFTNSIFGILPVQQIIYPGNEHKAVHFQQRTITMQLAQSLNQELQRPCQFNTL